MTALDPQRHLDGGSTFLVLALIAATDAGLLSARGDAVLLTTSWSGVGLAVGLLAISPLRRWPALAVALFLLCSAVGIASGVSTHVSVIVAASHVGQALVCGAVLTQLGRRRAVLETMRDLRFLGVASLLGGLVALAVETSVRSDDVRVSVEFAVQIAAQHAVSILLFGAFVLSSAPRFAHSDAGRLGAVPLMVWVQTTALGAVLAVVFLPTTLAPLTFAPIPILVWGAIAFEVRVAAGQLIALSGVVVLATAYGRGPFPNGVIADDLVGTVTLGYVVCAALVTLPLAVIVSQRRILMDQVVSDEQLFRRTFTESPLGMVLMRDEAGALEVVEVNAAAAGILGVPAGSLEGRRFADLVETLDHREQVFDALLAREVDVWHGQAAVLGRPGSRVDLAIAAISNADSSRVFSAQLLDQTQEQDSRRRLEAAHKLTDATLDTAACIILVTDESGTIVRINAATKEITGYDETELVGALVWETPLAALTRSETEAMFVWPNRSGYPMVRERLSYNAEGRPIRLVWNTNVVQHDAGAPSYAVLTGVDVTAERSSTGLMAHLLQASIATALIGIDVSGSITVVNVGAARMLGATPEALLGRPFVSILDPSQLKVRTGAVGEREAFLCLVGMISEREESATRDWTWHTRDGHQLIVSMTLSLTDDNGEDRVVFLCFARDVTEQREGQETLVAALDKERTAVERLRALDRAKDEFVSTVSHELRTPVTSILGYTEMLLDGVVVEPHPKQAAMLETIARNSHRLITVCNDLLLLSGFESPDALTRRETFDLCESIVAAEEFAEAASAQRRLTMTFTSPDEPVMVSGDRGQLDRVIVNLVGNAIKFTEDGGTIAVRLSPDDTVGALITVADTGIGIHPDDHELVFQRFYRTDTAEALAIQGTGLGLSIVSGIVDAHGGTIAVDSVPDEGTTFTVRLPLVH
ncbi:hypothetical protein BH09ACT12_BH09ACT12_20930 [soil metagenome]